MEIHWPGVKFPSWLDNEGPIARIHLLAAAVFWVSALVFCTYASLAGAAAGGAALLCSRKFNMEIAPPLKTKAHELWEKQGVRGALYLGALSLLFLYPREIAFTATALTTFRTLQGP